MKAIIAFTCEDNVDAMTPVLLQWRRNNVEVYLHADLPTPHFILYAVSEIIPEVEEKQLYFLTDNKDLFKIARHIYRSTFSGFIYVDLNEWRFEAEDPIYTYILGLDEPVGQELYFPSKNDKKLFLKSGKLLEPALWYYENIYYIFEPTAFGAQIISDNDENIPKLTPQNLCVCFHYTDDYINGLVEKIERIYDAENIYYRSTGSYFSQNEKELNDYFTNRQCFLSECSHFERLLYDNFFRWLASCYGDHAHILYLTAKLPGDIDGADKSRILEEICDIAGKSKALTILQKYYISFQMATYVFSDSSLSSAKVSAFKKHMNGEVYEYYKSKLTEYSFIPKEERNNDYVLLLTSQFIALGHGPTKTIIDRAIVIQEHLKKQLMIVNTAEMFAPIGEIPTVGRFAPTVMHSYAEIHNFEYEQYSIPFLQLDGKNPSLDNILLLFDLITKLKPYYIVAIGNSLTADLCAQLVPVLTVSTVFSGIPDFRTQFVAFGRKLSDEEKQCITDSGQRDIKSYIESTFTFTLKKQGKTFTRQALNLPEDKLLIIIVGARLDFEVTDEFISALLATAQYNTHLVFAGKFNSYEKIKAARPEFAEHSSFLGFVDEILAVNELCYMFANPHRLGGGTAVVEAMINGVVPVTIDFGDVASGAGKEFCVSDYKQMTEKIIEYINNEKLYFEMSEKAKKRADVLLDSKTEFARVLEKMENSVLFE